MNNIRTCLYVFLVLLVFPISGCDEIFQSKPEDVLSEYLQADLVGDHKTAYTYLSIDNKKNKSIEQYISEKSKHSGSACKVVHR